MLLIWVLIIKPDFSIKNLLILIDILIIWFLINKLRNDSINKIN